MFSFHFPLTGSIAPGKTKAYIEIGKGQLLQDHYIEIYITLNVLLCPLHYKSNILTLLTEKENQPFSSVNSHLFLSKQQMCCSKCFPGKVFRTQEMTHVRVSGSTIIVWSG